MSWRIVVVSNSAKLEYKMEYMVIRQDRITKIHMSEIALLMVETTAVSITAGLLCELTKRKIKVVFCDEKRNPSSELVGYYGSHDTSAKIRKQIEWSEDIKRIIWTEIVSEKIRNQKNFLEDLGKEESNLLEGYLREIQPGDSTNREGHAAKVYFNAVFGMEFSRTSDIPINAALNYGYGIILSAVNREIVANGYITQIGIFHKNRFNEFNLGCDIMEPIRPLIDNFVAKCPAEEELTSNRKMEIVNLLNSDVWISGMRTSLLNSLNIYVKSVLDSLTKREPVLIRFIEYEF